MHEVEARLRTARLVAGALGGGVGTAWLVCGFLVWQRDSGIGGAGAGVVPAELGFWVWAAAAGAGLVAALAFRGRARRLGAVAPSGPSDPVLTSLLIAWALLEGPALLGAVLFLLGGGAQLITAVPVYFLGFVATYPRAEWFQGPASAREWS